MAIEYLDPSIAGEGESANNWQPGVWTNTPAADGEEYQPDIEPPHINDYAAFKKHKHYRQYFRPHRYVAFPAWVYHPKEEPRIVKSLEEVKALGASWSPTPLKPRVDMTGKTLPVKSETQRLAEAVAAAAAVNGKGGAIDPTSIAAIVAAVMSAMQKPVAEASKVEATAPADEPVIADDATERKALIELAEKESIKIDGRWSNQRIKTALGI